MRCYVCGRRAISNELDLCRDHYFEELEMDHYLTDEYVTDLPELGFYGDWMCEDCDSFLDTDGYEKFCPYCDRE